MSFNRNFMEESQRLYVDWQENHSDMNQHDYIEQFASDDYKRMAAIAEEEVEDLEAEGCTV